MTKNELIALVEGAKRGNKGDFEKLYGEYYDRLYFFVLKNVGSKQYAEDITQESFLQAMENIGRLKSPETFPTWLHSIAYHKCKDVFRAESRNARFDTDEQFEQAVDNTALNEPVMLPDDYAVNKQRTRELKKMIDDLKPDMRSAVILYYYDDMSVAEVASALGMSENAAKQKLFQARKKLKQQIEKLYGKGGTLAAVPVGDMLHNTISPRYAAAKGGASNTVGSGMSGVKVACIAVAAVIAVGVPVTLGIMNNGDGGLVGDGQLPMDSGYVTEVQQDSSVAEPAAATPESKEETPADTTAQPDEHNEPEDSEYPQVVVPTENDEDSTDEPEVTIPEEDTSSQPGEVVPVEMSVDKMLSMDGAQLRALSNDNYEIVDAASAQTATFGLKCAAFPEYVFVLQRVDFMDNKPENTIKVPRTLPDGSEYVYELSDTITQLDLYEGAEVGSGIKVGMSFTEIKDLLGGELYMSMIGSSMQYAAVTEIGGRTWYLHFDLTPEQLDELYERLKESVEDGELSLGNPGKVDISDWDPVCDVAVHHLPWQET